jgi:hypothetical protein
MRRKYVLLLAVLLSLFSLCAFPVSRRGFKASLKTVTNSTGKGIDETKSRLAGRVEDIRIFDDTVDQKKQFPVPNTLDFGGRKRSFVLDSSGYEDWSILPRQKMFLRECLRHCVKCRLGWKVVQCQSFIENYKDALKSSGRSAPILVSNSKLGVMVGLLYSL